MNRICLMGVVGILGASACLPSVPEAGPPVEKKIDKPDGAILINIEQIKLRQNLISALEDYEAADVKTGRKSLYAQSLSMAGRSDIPFFDNVLRDPSNICISSEGQALTDPVDSILSAIGEHTLVIINENHNMPRDRAFILDLLKSLKAEGFTHYAAETFDPMIDESDSNFSSVTDGYYSNEPIFGRLLSFAKNEGFKLVAYEQTDEQRAPDGASREERINFRENAQRDNLMSSVLQAEPDTKMIVHVGHSHVAETPIANFSSNGSTKWMAARLKEKTGIDPLTLSQTACRSNGEVTAVASKVFDKDGNTVSSHTDYAIGHIPLTFTKNRPDWRRQIGDIEISIPTSLSSFAEPVLIEARQEGLPDAAVPVDRILIREGEGEIPLLLPVGNYRIEAFNKKGRLGNVEYLTVNKPE